jgi:hypothetical protein
VADARDDESKKQCLAAYEGGQRSRKQGELLAAREQLKFCGSPACPHAMHADCGQWLREVEAALPTVVFSARAESGELLAEASLSIDGGQKQRLDGRAWSVDPGEHAVSLSCPGFQPLEKRLLFSEGSKLQEVAWTLVPLTATAPRQRPDLQARPEAGPVLPAPPKPRVAARRSDLVVPMLAASGLALLAGGSFAYFGLQARASDRALDSCAPNCSRERVDEVKRDYLIANISLGAGIAGALASGTLLILSHSDAPTPSAAVRSTLRLGATTVWTTSF